MLRPTNLIRWAFFPTPHCKFCFHEKADFQHILWHCPRFQNIRENWPVAMLLRTNWPACAETALIFTKDMDSNLKGSWKIFQKFAAELLLQWMEICRNPDLYDPLPQQTLSIPKPQIPTIPCEADAVLKQKAFTKHAELFPLQWKPPRTRTDLNKWSATLEDYALIFSFWIRATFNVMPQAVAIKTWSQALAIFVPVGGKAAPFLTKCLNVGMAACKFKALSAHLLNSAFEQNQRFSLYDPPLPSKWLPSLPLELSFPDDVHFSHCWDLTQTAQRLHQLNMAIRINHHCNATAIRIATADFVDAIQQSKRFLQSVPLSGAWLIPTSAHKTWVATVLDLRLSPQNEMNHISCITQIPLSVWKNFTAEEIRSKIPGAPSARGRFKAALRRFSKFKDALATFLRLQMLDASPKAHIVQPNWSGNESCFCCHKFMRFSAEHSKITRTCPSPGALSESLAADWLDQFDTILKDIQHILDKIK